MPASLSTMERVERCVCQCYLPPKFSARSCVIFWIWSWHGAIAPRDTSAMKSLWMPIFRNLPLGKFEPPARNGFADQVAPPDHATHGNCRISYSVAVRKRAMAAAVGRRFYRFHTILHARQRSLHALPIKEAGETCRRPFIGPAAAHALRPCDSRCRYSWPPVIGAWLPEKFRPLWLPWKAA